MHADDGGVGKRVGKENRVVCQLDEKIHFLSLLVCVALNWFSVVFGTLPAEQPDECRDSCSFDGQF